MADVQKGKGKRSELLKREREKESAQEAKAEIRSKIAQATGKASHSSTGVGYILDLLSAYYADALSVFAGLMVIAYFNKHTTEYGALFVTLQHNVTVNVTGPNADNVRYVPGVLDPLFFLFLVPMIVVIHDVCRELLWQNLAKALSMPRDQHATFFISLTSVVFWATSLYMGFSACKHEKITSSVSNIWAGYPHALTLHGKLFIFLHIAFPLARVLLAFFLNMKRSQTTEEVKNAVFHIVFILPFYILGFSRLAVFAFFLGSLPHLLHSLEAALTLILELKNLSKRNFVTNLISGVETKTLLPKIARVRDVSFLVSRVVLLATTAYTFLVGLAGVPEAAPLAEGEEGAVDFNTMPVRMLMLGVAVASVAAHALIPHHGAKAHSA